MDRTIGFAGLGKMGKNIVLQMLEKGYKVVALNRSPAPLDEVVAKGAIRSSSLDDLVSKLGDRKVVWLMYPAGEVTDRAIERLGGLLKRGDIVIDGANNRYTDTVKHYEFLNSKGISMLDAGCSGGPSGARNGMCMMVGGDKDSYEYLQELFKKLSVPEGHMYTGPSGSGHFVKMVHNAIEYGMMQSLAEGVDLVANGPYKGKLDLGEITELWNHGSVIRSYLVELSARALKRNATLEGIEPYVEDNGEGRWSVNAAVEYAIPFSAISSSLFERFTSRSDKHFSHRLLAALRHEFGGHAIKES